MKEELRKISAEAQAEIAAASSEAELEAARVKYSGKKGRLTAILRGMGALDPDARREVGELANTVRGELEAAIAGKAAALRSAALEKRLAEEKLDVTLPGREKLCGRLHPLHTVENRIREIFIGMGFTVVDGPEIESTHNNFDALNAPADHPSRDFQDTFYIDETTLLRTQTSPVQIRAMTAKRHPSASSRPAVFTARTTWTRRIPRCSTRSRDWSSTRASRWPT